MCARAHGMHVENGVSNCGPGDWEAACAQDCVWEGSLDFLAFQIIVFNKQ